MAEFTFYNTSDELTLSADGLTYGYIGRASLQAVVQPSGTTTVHQAGYSTYTINWAADILVALPLKQNRHIVFVEATRSGNTWTITVRNSNGSFDANGFEMQESTDVFVFGAPLPGVLTMINLFDVNGNIVADLSRRPLTFKSIVIYGDNEVGKPMPIVASVPAVIGSPRDRYTSTASAGSGLFFNLTSTACWYWNTGTGQLEKQATRLIRTRDDGSIPNAQAIRPATAVIIEASGL